MAQMSFNFAPGLSLGVQDVMSRPGIAGRAGFFDRLALGAGNVFFPGRAANSVPVAQELAYRVSKTGTRTATGLADNISGIIKSGMNRAAAGARLVTSRSVAQNFASYNKFMMRRPLLGMAATLAVGGALMGAASPYNDTRGGIRGAMGGFVGGAALGLGSYAMAPGIRAAWAKKPYAGVGFAAKAGLNRARGFWRKPGAIRNMMVGGAIGAAYSAAFGGGGSSFSRPINPMAY